MKWHGKKILITGAASGIGAMMAKKMGNLGAELILWDINKEALDNFTDALKRDNIRCSSYLCDLTNVAAIEATATTVIDTHGYIDILINNAGIVTGKSSIDSTTDDIQRTFAVNTLALFWTTKLFLPIMLERNTGHIVTIASAAGITSIPKLVDYSASKFAAFGFADALRLELKKCHANINTTLVCPYFINTGKTGLFAGVKTRFPFLLPILNPDYVTNKIIHAIEKRKARLILPRFVITVFLCRIFPVSLYDKVL